VATIPLTERPVDLALFTEEEAPRYINSPYLVDSRDKVITPWIRTAALTDEPYFEGPTPLTVNLKFDTPCYVSQIIVQPYTRALGVSKFSARIVTPTQETVELDPPAQVDDPPLTPEDVDTEADPYVLTVAPKYAEEMQFLFERSGAEHIEGIYIEKIRVLGWPARSPVTAQQAILSSDEEDLLAKGGENLARFEPSEIEQHVTVSEGRHPNGRYEIPFLPNPDEVAEQSQVAPYWCAPAPAWVEIDLGKPCCVTGVRIQPYSDALGATSFYAKVFDPDGNELDTVPPCEAQIPVSPGQDELHSAPPMEATFTPTETDRVKIYLPAGGSANNWVYISHIEVVGIPIG